MDKPKLSRSLEQPFVKLVATAARVSLLHGPWLHAPANQELVVGMTDVEEELERARGARRVRSRQVASGEVAMSSRAEVQLLEILGGKMSGVRSRAGGTYD